MKFFNTLLFFIFLSLFSFAQSPQFFYTDCAGAYLGRDEHSIYLLPPLRDKICVVNDQDLTLIREIPIKTKEKQHYLRYPIVKILQGKIYVLSKNKNNLTCSILKKNGDPIQTEEALLAIEPNATIKCEIQNNNKLAVVTSSDKVIKGNTLINVTLFDENLTQLHSLPVRVPYSNVSPERLKLNGNILTLMNGNGKLKFYGLNFNSKSSHEITFDAKKNITDYAVFQSNESESFLFGIEEDKLSAGLHVLSINNEGEIMAKVFIPSSKLSILTWNDKLDHVLQDSSGYYLIFEQSDVPNKGETVYMPELTSSSSVYGGIGIIKLNKSFDIEWKTRLAKLQQEPSVYRFKESNLASYFVHINQDYVKIMYNDLPSNIHSNIKEPKSANFTLAFKKKLKETACIDVSIEKSNGAMSKKVLYSNTENFLIHVTSGIKLSETDFLFSAYDPDNYKFFSGLLKIK